MSAVVKGRVAVRPAPERPWLTFALLGANVLAFAACSLAAGEPLLLSVPPTVLVAFGANVAPFTQFGGAWENLVTNTFLHGGLVHLLFNMVALWQVGPFVEQTIGRARFATMYGFAAIVASLTSMAAANYGYLNVGLAVGASGAICGLIGGSTVLGFRLQGRRSPLAMSMLRWLGITVVLGYVISRSGQASIDNFAHVGGALAGAVCALLFRRSVQYTSIGRALRVAALGVLVTGAFVVQIERSPALGRAKLTYLLGACDETKVQLHDAHVGAFRVAEIVRRCETR